jgi:O-antigen ligase
VLRSVSVRIGAALWLAPVTPPLISLFRSSVPTAVEGLAIAIAAAACIHPAFAIGLAGALLPLGVTLGAALQIPFSWTEPLALAVIAGIAARYLIAPRPLPEGAGPVLAWTALLAVLAAASAAVDCAAQLAFYPSAASLARDVWHSLGVQYLVAASRFTALRPALTMIEGLGLLTAAIVSIDRARHSAVVATFFLLGAAAVSLQNIFRLWQIALRSGGEFWPTLAADLVSVRVSAAFADLNTAGSYLVMAVVMALVWRCRRAVWRLLLIPLLAVALWISGSRAALAAAPLALALALAPRRGRWWLAGALAVLAVAVLFATQWFRPTTAPGSALFIRVELAKAGMAMLRDAPVFGIGIGNFYETSERYASPALAHFYVRENAHNQYVQIAAELGLAAIGAVLAVLVLVFRRALRDRARRPDSVRDAVLAGLLAFLLSAIGGHPLLIPEVALVFWIVVGLAWASSASEPEATSPRLLPATRSRVAFAIAVAVVAIATPWRIERAAAALPLEHVGVRMSPWQRDEQGRRFRTMRGHAAIYVPATGGPVRFLARIGSGGPEELRLRLSFDGRLVNEVRLSREWRPVDLIVPREVDAAFRRLELDVAEPSGAAADAAADIGIVQAR